MSNEITGRISSNTITGRISSDTIITSNVIYGHTHSNKKILDQILSGSSGDMLVSIYDPNFVNGDAFSVDNHVSGTINKVYTLKNKVNCLVLLKVQKLMFNPIGMRKQVML